MSLIKKHTFLIIIIFTIGLHISCSAQESATPESSVQEAMAATGEQTEETNETESGPDVTPTDASEAEPTEQTDEGMRTYVIVPEQSTASYLASEEFFEDALSKYGIEAGHNDVVGSTQVIEGQIQLNPDDMSSLLGENNFSVDMRTFETDQSQRDNWIRENGPQFNRFPVATFVANEVSDVPDSYAEGEEIQFDMSGTLTVREVSVPVTFDVTAILENGTLTGTAETSELMSDFGIEPPDFLGTLTVEDEFGIRIDFTAREQ